MHEWLLFLQQKKKQGKTNKTFETNIECICAVFYEDLSKGRWAHIDWQENTANALSQLFGKETLVYNVKGVS